MRWFDRSFVLIFLFACKGTTSKCHFGVTFYIFFVFYCFSYFFSRHHPLNCRQPRYRPLNQKLPIRDRPFLVVFLSPLPPLSSKHILDNARCKMESGEWRMEKWEWRMKLFVIGDLWFLISLRSNDLRQSRCMVICYLWFVNKARKNNYQL